MSKRLMPVLAAVMMLCIVLVGAWVAGFNFDERGFDAFFVFYLAIVMTGAAYTAAKHQTR